MGILDTILKVAVIGGVAYAAYMLATGGLKLSNGKEQVVSGGVSPLTILVPGTTIIPAVADIIKQPLIPEITTASPFTGAEVPVLPSPAGLLFPVVGILELIEKLTRPGETVPYIPPIEPISPERAAEAIQHPVIAEMIEQKSPIIRPELYVAAAPVQPSEIKESLPFLFGGQFQ